MSGSWLSLDAVRGVINRGGKILCAYRGPSKTRNRAEMSSDLAAAPEPGEQRARARASRIARSFEAVVGRPQRVPTNAAINLRMPDFECLSVPITVSRFDTAAGRAVPRSGE
jgi:hypothetical protein